MPTMIYFDQILMRMIYRHSLRSAVGSFWIDWTEGFVDLPFFAPFSGGVGLPNWSECLRLQANIFKKFF